LGNRPDSCQDGPRGPEQGMIIAETV